HGPAAPGLVQAVEFLTFAQILKTLTDSLFGERRNPEALDWLAALGFMDNPALNDLALLSGVAAVDDFDMPASLADFNQQKYAAKRSVCGGENSLPG
nr:hypothetical protein [Tanacetum cinerariifolium]